MTADDFTLGNMYLVFDHTLIGQTLCTSFSPVDDAIVEDTECFTFRFSAVSGRSFFVDNATNITVCIEDDDSELLMSSKDRR